MDTTKNPWTIHSRETKYDNNWISVWHHEGLNPTGGQGIYGVVHFKNQAIGVVALDEENNIYLVGQYRFPLEQYSWEIPEGGGPLGEPALDAAKRELLEETGLVARHWEVITRLALSNSVSDETGVVFLARGLEQRQAEPEETEQLMVKKVPFEEAYRMVDRFEITDSLSVAAIQKVKLMMYEGLLNK
ncbi:ADP-ribose pyrophosphatase YjhB (NUDIX family) [Chitinophaga polysaccharea]|uniref:GDP-mannose pyrophosphatase n=1 Tax=Chitinophaga polysaccharea TaxID=1293035 RepID=A0A561P6Z0_9BACT|nr:NUDIX hydrolase [Chitinophaga polysaccharea]TWF33895.1 ADP-ribose pyrophosphatase YjhB (NUDIX family) [Chitinophaga polysaccharea]